MEEKQKKPWYKRGKTWLYVFAAIVLIGTIRDLTGNTAKQETIQVDKTEDKAALITTKEADADEESDTEIAVIAETVIDSAEPAKAAQPEIDTSVFEYATETKVTDAIEINDHVTVFVHVRDEANPGLSTLDIMTQTFDFIQQDDMKGAKTVTIAVKQGAIKIAQFTATTDKFIPDEDTPMAQLVRDASEIDFMSDEVKEFGKAMDMW